MRYLILFSLIFNFANIFSQSKEKAEKSEPNVSENRVNLIAVPLAFYLPETRFGFGGAANASMHWKNQNHNERPTQFTFGIAYTLNKQLLSYLFYQIYTPTEKYWFRGELGYYDYIYPFFGIGQEITLDNSNFFSSFFRFRIDALQQVHPNVFVGPSYRFDDYKINGIQDDLNLFEGVDTSGGITSGLGLAVVVDTRDIINYPSNGMLFDFVFHVNDDAIGASYQYTALQMSFSKYLPIRDNVLALNFNTTNIFGIAPFYELALFGGAKRSRGYIEGEYRGNNGFAIQAEYRFRFKNKLKRFGAVIFASVGQIFQDLEEVGFQYTLPAVGTGIRFMISEEQKLNLRADVGFGLNGPKFYVTFAEAF